MSLLGNILWIIFGGLFTCVEYLVAGISLCCTIIGIPWGLQAFKLGILSLLPFGSEVVDTPASDGALPLVANIVWLVVWGWGIALTHLLFAGLCGITVIGIPFALQHWKLAKLALWPFGKDIRDRS